MLLLPAVGGNGVAAGVVPRIGNILRKTTDMKKLYILIALFVGASSIVTHAGDNKIISMGYLGFRDAGATLDSFQKLADAGLDMITLEMDQSSAQLQFDLAQETGVKIMAVLAPFTERSTLEEVDFNLVDELVLRFKACWGARASECVLRSCGSWA